MFFCLGKNLIAKGNEALTMPHEGQMNALLRTASSATCLKLCKFNCLTQFKGDAYNDKTKYDAKCDFIETHKPGVG
jgi:hypothetical protein